MSTVEDRLRAATRAAARTVPPGSAPPLVLPERSRAAGGGRGGPRLRSWLVPLAAAMAVAAAIGTSVAVSGILHGHRYHHPRPAAAASPLSGLPAYYVTLTGSAGKRAVVRATATGAVVATLSPPHPYRVFDLVATSGNGREFVVAAARLTIIRRDGGKFFNTGPPSYFLLRIGPSGAQLTALHIPALRGNEAESAALSPDGSKLALAVRGGGGPPPAIKVITLATGAERVWTWPGGPPITNNAGGSGEVLSWAADGTVAFQQWAGNSIDVRLLDTAAPGNSLQRDSKLALQWRHDAETFHYTHGQITNVIFGYSAIITPDGSKIVAATASVTKKPLNSELAFTEFAASTGTVQRVLYPQHLPGLYPGQVEDVLWSNSSGSKLIVVAHRPGPPVPLGKHGRAAGYPIEFGVVSGNRFTPLPGAPSMQSLGFGSWPVW